MATARTTSNSVVAPNATSPAVIEVRDLTFTYPKSTTPAVRGMGFTVGAGEIFGFLGPSGAGKSTTQKILTGLLRGHGGDVSIWGESPQTWGKDYYEKIGVSFELPNHYLKLTARENLEFFASLYGTPTEDPGELLDMVGLGDVANTRVSKFSKGMQMRLVFVRALLNQPRLLFLDEPTSGLDPRNSRIVKDVILDLKRQGRTVFVTTHDMATAEELCDTVAFVVDGQIATMGPPTELKVARSRRSVRVDYRDEDTLTSSEFGLDGLADDSAFHELLRNRRVEAVHSQEADLNDVFIEVTGRSLS
ncbi:ABC transporter ATP-binding protein [Spiractinospora alimapuensis]|uniref:ABC transporter ATP-binding protein n=1 Tax=Spiractinospora alimapuensis TaxID=2820884 RepID=UPI001F48BE0D|nr:ABC transporter ATP-binding protein [Spiractinospora alimapuensis]QVQ53801.1 ABC transporter ATP-binding protein [Spiractinospora alimapuensis]